MNTTTELALLPMISRVAPAWAARPAQTDEPTDDATGDAAEASQDLVDRVVDSLPRVGVGLAIIIVGYIVGKVLKKFLEPRLAQRRSPSFGRVISSLIGYGVIVVTFVLGLTAMFPSIKPVDLMAGLGIFSIAIGFAFQDILSNLLAGLLLLIRQPFESGDQIEVSGQRGTVQGITIRETQIKTFDGEKIIIPNAEVYQNVIRVQTAYGPKRTTLTIGLDDWEDLDRAADVIVEATRGVDGVESDPDPQAYFFEFGDSTTNLQLRYWTQPEQAEVRRVQDQVVRAVGRALREAEISMPSPITELDARESVQSLIGATSGASGGSGGQGGRDDEPSTGG